jgi:hypothetical protein
MNARAGCSSSPGWLAPIPYLACPVEINTSNQLGTARRIPQELPHRIPFPHMRNTQTADRYMKEALYILYIHSLTVSNTDNINILCKYLMYILTDYRLILTKDRPDLSSEKVDPNGTALARLSPLVREGATKITNPQLSKENFKEIEKLVAGPRWAPHTKTGWPTDCRS